MRSVRLLFVALALALASPAAAVTTQVGVLAGFSFSNLRMDGDIEIEGRSSFAFGGVADLGFNERFGIRIEPTWLSKGAKATYRNAEWGSIDGAVFQLDYLDIPVLARFDLATTPQRAYLLGGLGVSFATEQKVELTQSGAVEEADFGDVLEPMDLSLDLGLGLSFDVGSNRMTVDGRAAIGLMDINNGGTITLDGSPVTVPPTSVKTLDFRLFVTYLFPLSRE